LISVEVSMRASACIDGTKPDRAVASRPRAATTQPQSSAEAPRCAMLAYLDDTVGRQRYQSDLSGTIFGHCKGAAM
jgi:hypothetical protein